MPVRIGLPRGLFYYYYGTAWETFFRELGAEVIISPETSKQMLHSSDLADEVCLPVKVYCGHVAQLCRDVDYVFIPRLISVAQGQYTCPKMMGLPDLLRNSVRMLPAVIDVTINLRPFGQQLPGAVVQAGKAMKATALSSLRAWYHAWRRPAPLSTEPQVAAPGRMRVALIGHPYIIFDHLISMDIVGKLNRLGVTVVTAQTVNDYRARTAARRLEKPIYWSFSQHLVGAALFYLDQASVDGMIFMTAFGCGPDSLTAEVVKRHAQSSGIPFMALPVDEHTAEAGFVTRLEAFVDMLGRRCSK